MHTYVYVSMQQKEHLSKRPKFLHYCIFDTDISISPHDCSPSFVCWLVLTHCLYCIILMLASGLVYTHNFVCKRLPLHSSCLKHS